MQIQGKIWFFSLKYLAYISTLQYNKFCYFELVILFLLSFLFILSIYFLEKTSVHVSLMELDKSEKGQSSKVHLHDKKKWPTGFFTQYTQLTLRTFKTSKSQIFSKFKLIETVVLTCIVSLIWFQLPRTEETLRDRLGVVC